MYPQTMGTCGKCRQLKVQAGDEIKCLRCDAPKPKESKRINTVEDPGEAGLARVLNESGISLPKGEKPDPISKPEIKLAPHVPEAKIPNTTNYVFEALQCLKKVPVPNDLKQFKKIRKAIDLLESL